MTDRLPGFSTLAVHAGAQPDPTTGARATPIYQTTSFVFNDADHAASLFGLQSFGNIYTRIGNPTNAVLEERVAALEGGTAALAVASGHAAQVVVLQQLLMPGDEIIAARKLYGGSINQFTHAFKSFGWNVAWAEPDDIEHVNVILAWIAGIAASFLWAPLSHNTKSLEGVIHAASAVESIDGVVRAMLDHRGIIAPWFVGELLAGMHGGCSWSMLKLCRW